MILRDMRTKAGITQQQMTELFGIPRRTYENWESGTRKCPKYVENLIIDKLEDLAIINDQNKFSNEYQEETRKKKELKTRSVSVYKYKGVDIYFNKEICNDENDLLDYFTIVGFDIRCFKTIDDAKMDIEKDWKN
jgi:transcriptional regulator with XRE-family HTH domain